MDFVLAGDGYEVFPPRKLDVNLCIENEVVRMVREIKLSSQRVADFAFADKVESAFGADSVDRCKVNVVLEGPRVGNHIGDQS